MVHVISHFNNRKGLPLNNVFVAGLCDSLTATKTKPKPASKPDPRQLELPLPTPPNPQDRSSCSTGEPGVIAIEDPFS